MYSLHWVNFLSYSLDTKLSDPETILDNVVVLWKANLGNQLTAKSLLIGLLYIYSCIRLKDWKAVNFIIKIIVFQETVLEELSSYDGGSQIPYWPSLKFRGRRLLYWWPGSATAGQVFEVSYRIKFHNCSLRNYDVKFYKPGNSCQINNFISCHSF